MLFGQRFKMAIFLPILFSILVLQTTSRAAPNVLVNKNIEEDPKLDNEPYGAAETINVDSKNENNERQKRYFDYNVELEYPPYNFDFNYPYPSRFNYNKRDESQNIGGYGTEGTLRYVLRYLQKIVRDIRQQSSVSHVPISTPTYIPLFYIPQVDCSCISNNNPPSPTNNNNNNQHTTKSPTNQETNTPELPDRLGPVNDDVDEDGNRPISLDPVEPSSPLDVPVPPVEHGSVQAGAKLPQNVPTTKRTPSNSPTLPSISKTEPPGLCEAAVLFCCLQPQITQKCFERQGCPDPSIYGNPCEPQTFRQILERVYTHVKQRNG
ncbi:unnamed protein product, partial [Brenthis ino]